MFSALHWLGKLQTANGKISDVAARYDAGVKSWSDAAAAVAAAASGGGAAWLGALSTRGRDQFSFRFRLSRAAVAVRCRRRVNQIK